MIAQLVCCAALVGVPGGSPSAMAEVYQVTWTSLELRGELGRISELDLSTEGLDALKKSDRVLAQEEISCTTISGLEAMVRFGRRLPVTVGETIAGPQRTRIANQQMMEFGTVAEFMLKETDRGTVITLDYESSSPKPVEEGALAPAVETTQVHSSVLVTPGQPILISSMSASQSRLVVLTVTRVDQQHDTLSD